MEDAQASGRDPDPDAGSGPTDPGASGSGGNAAGGRPGVTSVSLSPEPSPTPGRTAPDTAADRRFKVELDRATTEAAADALYSIERRRRSTAPSPDRKRDACGQPHTSAPSSAPTGRQFARSDAPSIGQEYGSTRFTSEIARSGTGVEECSKLVIAAFQYNQPHRQQVRTDCAAAPNFFTEEGGSLGICRRWQVGMCFNDSCCRVHRCMHCLVPGHSSWQCVIPEAAAIAILRANAALWNNRG